MDDQTFLTTVGGVFEQMTETALPAPESVARSADFPGTDSGENSEYLQEASSVKFIGSGSWTITAFVRPEFLASATNPRGVFSKGVNPTAAPETFVMGITIDRTGVDLGRARLFYSNGVDTVSSVSSANGSIANNTWHFIEATFNASTNVLSVNIDRGTPATTSSVSENTEDITADFRIGGTFDTGVNDFDGQISLVGFFQRILTSGELDALYNSGVGVLFADIGTANDAVSAYIELDEASGDRADSSGGTSLSPTQPIGSSVNVPS